MAKHIHVHLYKSPTVDAGTKHDPKNGQFTGSGGGASGGKPYDIATASGKEHADQHQFHKGKEKMHQAAAQLKGKDHPDFKHHVNAERRPR